MSKKPVTVKEIIGFLSFVLITSIGCFFILKGYALVKLDNGFIASSYKQAPIYDGNFKEVKYLNRGTEIKYNVKEYVIKDKTYYLMQYENKDYYIDKENIVSSKNKVVLEKILYVRTPVTIYKNTNDSDIVSFIKKGEAIEVIGFNQLNEDGSVDMYKIKYQDYVGYVYGKYLVKDKDVALLNYDETASYQIHKQREDFYGGGSAATLDYYPVTKVDFENNVMPDEVRSLYLNIESLTNIDEYIKLAKDSNINAFVVDIKENKVSAYKSEVMKEYSITQYNHAYYEIEDYQKIIKKLKDNGFYVIGRITLFKDSFYVMDHPDKAIISTQTSKPYEHNGSYWPSPYDRDVWEFNVALAQEAVTLMGFNEIQFDYIRFPDGIYYLEKEKLIDLQNTYQESKAEAIQNFLFYATDQLHKIEAYVSADVFGESAHSYVTSYGQYFPAISNVVDVISAMPYPDHFDEHQYNIEQIVWEVPYKLLNIWGTNYVMKRQEEIPTPAKLRTWIQVYDAIKDPYTIYDDTKVSDQIRGLYNAGLTDGYMTWNSASSLEKYKSVKKAFEKEYER